MIFRTFALHLFLLCCWVGAVSSARAELVIELTQGVDNPITVASVPFGITGGNFNIDDIAKIVGDDLARSGQFRALPRGDMLARPTRNKDVFYRDWKAVRSDYLIIGGVQQDESGGNTVRFELHDVAAGKALLAKSFPAYPSSKMRDVAHAISDMVYEQITGVKGAFSTRLLYVTVERSRTASGIRARYGLQYADSDGARAITVRESTEPLMSPTWSPDGTRFAYVSFEGGYPGIWIQQASTGQREKLASFPGINGAPAWSPDGRQLAVTLSRDGNPEIYLYDMTSHQMQRLTNHPAIDTEPSWSADGKSLVFTSSRSGGPQIYRLDISNQAVTRLTFDGNYNARGRLAADGRTLVMVHRDEQKRFRIATQDLERGGLRVLTDTILDESPSLSPNGAMVIYATQRDGKSVLSAVSVDGRVQFVLPARQGEVREPAWSPFRQ